MPIPSNMLRMSSSTKLVEWIGRVSAGALGWVLVFMGTFGALFGLVQLFFGPEWRGPVGSLVVLAVSLLVVAMGIYGNPTYRERIHATLG
ncbi:hypothetical protein VNG_0999H [Halobacterium salinarum NRC-1]|uniref:Uncharacterized protein n=5 Tax=Halobacterium salinarum TaxID=2242 RepID=Q9HQU6_HALSA|nr:hypothetical protein VNG_0999H [Halobacterium salinarum NRC-1]MCF2207348.1 hypothetical protein [Halobacterium salinarum]CAP13691.1 uncharacterized protein OE_2453R [Halobacterium salinarum R1]MCF2239932.1 hypothetical protein [Halobacterium salinarum]QCC44831.1 uncharacterized protein HBSAL_05825 [Halobacterium salinarum]